MSGWYVEVCASKKSPECSMAVELEFGIVCSMLGEMGDEMALQRSSVKMLIQFFFRLFFVKQYVKDKKKTT